MGFAPPPPPPKNGGATPVAPTAGAASVAGGHPPNGELWNVPGLHWIALPLFLIAYFAVPDCTPLAVMALLACTLYRLDDYKRRIAAVPVSFAAMMLASRICGAAFPLVGHTTGLAPTAAWVPFFLAACILYMPKQPSITNNFFLALAGLILVSGLLPGDAYVGVFATAQVFMFMGLVTCLAIDFARNPQPATAN
jgi:hypothetical protein